MPEQPLVGAVGLDLSAQTREAEVNPVSRTKSLWWGPAVCSEVIPGQTGALTRQDAKAWLEMVRARSLTSRTEQTEVSGGKQ